MSIVNEKMAGEFNTIRASEVIDKVDFDAINEKVAAKLDILKALKKPLIAGALVASGAVGNEIVNRKQMKNYIEADRQRDIINAQRAYRFGAAAMYQRLVGRNSKEAR